jgi:hypothetical protein
MALDSTGWPSKDGVDGGSGACTQRDREGCGGGDLSAGKLASIVRWIDM